MSTTETTTTAHGLRTIILRFDPAKKAPEFETLALAYFRELHDRALQNQQRVRQGRKQAFRFTLWFEDAEELFKEARDKFRHLEIMLPENPERDTVREQLKALLSDINDHLDGSIRELIDETTAFYDYDDHLLQYDQWMHEVAFPQFDQVFKRYEECSVDMVSFDRDLNDFKGVLAAITRQEAKYYESMNELIENYSDLNLEISDLFDQVEALDPTLV